MPTSPTATGAIKAPIVDCENAGRIRYLDLGFFAPERDVSVHERVLTSAILDPLRALRPAHGDKRGYGHLCILGGSRQYPGAVLMNVLAALQSGVGLVTAFVPETLVPAYAARAPEAMWVAWPETPNGSLALEGLHLWKERAARATALAIGSGMGREPETLALAEELVKIAGVPVLLDADALQPNIIAAAKCPLLLTPHAGEFERISGGKKLAAYCAAAGATVILKGPVTRICSGVSTDEKRKRGKAAAPQLKIYHSFFGGPVLSRGGSGDILAGLDGRPTRAHARHRGQDRTARAADPDRRATRGNLARPGGRFPRALDGANLRYGNAADRPPATRPAQLIVVERDLRARLAVI